MPDRPLVLGTRGSALALWQAHHVRDRLIEAGYSVQLEVITTTGDRRLDVPLSQIGEKGLFTRELDTALIGGEIDLAVHSLKDLPSVLPEGVGLAAVTARSTAADAFVPHPSFHGNLHDVPPRGTIATSSLRRQAQLKAWRSDLDIVSVRGNVDTRLGKLDDGSWHGMILAEAGLRRLGLGERVRHTVPHEIMIPAVGQGALGVVCAEARPDLANWLATTLEDATTRAATSAERALLRRLEGGCTVPVAGHAVVAEGRLVLEGCVGDIDGSRLFRERAEGAVSEAQDVGTRLAETLLERGAGAILAALRK